MITPQVRHLYLLVLVAAGEYIVICDTVVAGAVIVDRKMEGA